TNSLVFNYKQMIKYGISRGSISDDVELVSKPDSILSKYKNIIILSVIIFIITIIFTIIHYIFTIKTNKNLKEAKKIAENANSFIANISHELRTTDNVISSTAQLMKKKIDSSDIINIESINSNINMIEQNSYRLTRLINNIIDVTKSDSGEKSLILQNVEIIG